MNPWGSFLVVVAVQLTLFLYLAYQKRAVKRITFSLIAESLVIGLILGIVFDFVVGKYLGIFHYVLGFDLLFLSINGALSYGAWVLTMQFLRQERLLSFFAWTALIGLTYEITNYFSPVWVWTFGGSFWYQEGVVILVGYCGLAMIAAFATTLLTKKTFKAFSFKTWR